MKKFILLSLLALLGAAPIPAFARELSRAECVTRIETCEAILQEFQADPAYAIPPSILQKAKAIVVVNQFKAGFFLGVKDGYGFIMVKQASGRWSLPVLISAGEASFGFQIGAKSVETIMIVTDEQTPRLIFNERFNIGVDAKAVIGPRAAEAEHLDHQIINAPILIYTKTKGLYAGATLKAGYLSRNDRANFMLYKTQQTMPELLYSEWVTPVSEVTPLMHLVERLTQ